LFVAGPFVCIDKLLYGKYHLIARKVTCKPVIGVAVVPMVTNEKPFRKKVIIKYRKTYNYQIDYN
jgi:hypothetical protein